MAQQDKVSTNTSHNEAEMEMIQKQHAQTTEHAQTNICTTPQLPKDIFKLTRPIFGKIELALCKDCQTHHFNDKTKFNLADDGVEIKIKLCSPYVKKNMEANEEKYWTKGAGKYIIKGEQANNGRKRKLDTEQ